MKKIRQLFYISWCIALAVIGLTACKEESLSDISKLDSSELQAEINELILRSQADMVFVEGGQFTMGKLTLDELPQFQYEYYKYYDLYQPNERNTYSKVTLDSYYLSRFQVTVKDYLLYRKVRDYPDNPYPLDRADLSDLENSQDILTITKLDNLKYHKIWEKLISIAYDYDEPVRLPWQEAERYCHWLGELTSLPYSLPTNAQWEYAAKNRGKDNTYFATDNGLYELYINIPERSDFTLFKRLIESEYDILLPIGWYPANELGIYDLGANGYEWMLDWYDSAYYDGVDKINPQGPSHSKLNKSESTIWGDRGNTDMYKIVRGFDPSYIYYYYYYPVMFSVSPISVNSGKNFDGLSDFYSTVRCAVNTSQKFY